MLRMQYAVSLNSIEAVNTRKVSYEIAFMYAQSLYGRKMMVE